MFRIYWRVKGNSKKYGYGKKIFGTWDECNKWCQKANREYPNLHHEPSNV